MAVPSGEPGGQPVSQPDGATSSKDQAIIELCTAATALIAILTALAQQFLSKAQTQADTVAQYERGGRAGGSSSARRPASPGGVQS